jgi:hypothetical protein
LSPALADHLFRSGAFTILVPLNVRCVAGPCKASPSSAAPASAVKEPVSTMAPAQRPAKKASTQADSKRCIYPYRALFAQPRKPNVAVRPILGRLGRDLVGV